MPLMQTLDPEPELDDTPLPEPPRGRAPPPPLPPRGESSSNTLNVPDTPPPPYEVDEEKRSRIIAQQWRSKDPRSSSTHSLIPSESSRHGRRTLLLIYIHGFMGNETSFQSFPAHVHNLLTMTMTETHVVHTKIYPRYKSRRAIAFARDEFSAWLEPHEGPEIDIILLGHSMGGLLAVEVALIPGPGGRGLRHPILGTISFDTPFLGMHPGLVTSGIASLFRPAATPPTLPLRGDSSTSGVGTPASSAQSLRPMSLGESTTSLSQTESSSSSLRPSVKDPNYDPPFPNDVRLPERSGWGKLFHFVSKHSDGLTSATKEYFMSHIEFGGCLADFQGLKNRYAKVRALEDVDEYAGMSEGGHTGSRKRVRFLNYYTASTGLPKKPKVDSSDKDGRLHPVEGGMSDLSLSSSDSPHTTSLTSGGSSQNLPESDSVLEQTSAIGKQMENLGEASGVDGFTTGAPPPLQHIDSMPIPDDEIEEEEAFHSANELTPTASVEVPLGPLAGDPSDPSQPPLPPIPSLPTEPTPVDLSIYADKDSRKIAEKEQKRVMKAYQQAVKDRDNAIKDRKVLEKREKKQRQENEKKLKDEAKVLQKELQKELKEREKLEATINPEVEAKAAAAEGPKPEKPKKDRKFCLLPSDVNGHRDKCWVRIYMEGVDEVGAHCGLFFPGPQYESLVGDVGARVEEWVKEDASRRAVIDAHDVD